MKIYNTIKDDFVDTCEAYSKCVFLGSNNLVIPYLNIGLMPSNPINGKQSVVDFSYYVFRGVESTFFNASKGHLTIQFDVPRNASFITEYVIVGGYQNENGAEVKIVCEEKLFFLPATSLINDSFHLFSPVDTHRFNRNMEIERTDAFFLKQNLPFELKEILGNDLCSIMLW